MLDASAVVTVQLEYSGSRQRLEYPRSLDFSGLKSYDSSNVEVREFTFNRCPSPRPDR